MSKASSTPGQLADWLGRCTDAERLRFAARALDAFERASQPRRRASTPDTTRPPMPDPEIVRIVAELRERAPADWTSRPLDEWMPAGDDYWAIVQRHALPHLSAR